MPLSLVPCLSWAAELLWPRRCGACDAEAGPGPLGPLFCKSCAATLLPISPATACPRCAAPLPGHAHSPCGDCRRLRPVFDRVTAPFQYGGALGTALQRLKWQGRDDLAAPLSALLVPGLSACAGRCDLVVPVPLHARRLVQRGYNQAGLLAGAALRAAGLPLALDLALLYRRGAAPSSVAKGWRDRRVQAQGAFFVPERAARRVGGRRVLLCDDVVTTGATAQACARSLLAAGAASVEVLTLCRAAP